MWRSRRCAVQASSKPTPTTRAIIRRIEPAAMARLGEGRPRLGRSRAPRAQRTRRVGSSPAAGSSTGSAPEACVVREIAEEVSRSMRRSGALVDVWVYEVVPDQHVLIVTYGCTAEQPREAACTAQNTTASSWRRSPRLPWPSCRCLTGTGSRSERGVPGVHRARRSGRAREAAQPCPADRTARGTRRPGDHVSMQHSRRLSGKDGSATRRARVWSSVRRTLGDGSASVSFSSRCG